MRWKIKLDFTILGHKNDIHKRGYFLSTSNENYVRKNCSRDVACQSNSLSLNYSSPGVSIINKIF